MKITVQYKQLIYILLCFLILNSCTFKENDTNEEIKTLLNKGYFDKRLNKANVEWEYETLNISKTNNIIFANSDVNKKAKEILQNQAKLTKYYKFLQSLNITERNLAFPFFNDEQYTEIDQLSANKGFDLTKLRELDAKNKMLYEDIRSMNEKLNPDSTLYKIDCTLILSKSEKTSQGSFTFWFNSDKSKLFKISNNNNKLTKAINNVIENAINNNY